MKHIGLLLLIYAALVLQTSLSGLFEVWGISPDFLMLGMIAALIIAEGSQTVVWAGGIGLLKDSLSAEPLGVTMVVGTLGAFCYLRWYGDSRNRSILLTTAKNFSFTFLVLFASIAMQALLTSRVFVWEELLRDVGGIAAYTVLVGGVFQTVVGVSVRAWPIEKAAARERRTNRWRMLTDY